MQKRNFFEIAPQGPGTSNPPTQPASMKIDVSGVPPEKWPELATRALWDWLVAEYGADEAEKRMGFVPTFSD